MSYNAIIALYCISFRFALNQLLYWYHFFVWLPIIRCHNAFGILFYFIPQDSTCFCSPVSENKINEFSCLSINSSPNPSIVFFEPT